MKMPQGDVRSVAEALRGALITAPDPSDRRLHGIDGSVRYADVLAASSLGGRAYELAGRSVLIRAGDQLTTALALIELDGRVRRMVLATPDLKPEHLSAVIEKAGVDAIVTDRGADTDNLGIDLHVACGADLAPVQKTNSARYETEWVLLTSGTTGAPKLVVHTLASLTSAIVNRASQTTPVVWATFYDIRRYGGLQIFLRAVLAARSLVLSSAGEAPDAHLARLGAHGITHISGTPSHWRRALWSPAAQAISPDYVRLSGEIADQAILDNLHAAYPKAAIGHAYAATEAGVGFAVDDGREGFPADYVSEGRGGVAMKVVDGSLRLRSSGLATRYLGDDNALTVDADGFIDTGDLVELRGDRYFFTGRRGGVINVGGQKVHPEEVEVVINRHPQVRMSQVRSKKNPITGAIVVADVVLAANVDPAAQAAQLKREIIDLCRGELAQYKVPAAVNFVAALNVAETGKLVRSHA
jgi:acyl-coenzyme A synthetase/AMP-(fatty) acid ligase